MHSENVLLNEENATLRKQTELLSLQVEKAKRESLGMREQGPRAAVDEVCVQLKAENIRLKEECQKLLSSQDINSEHMELGRYGGTILDVSFISDVVLLHLEIKSKRLAKAILLSIC